MARSHSAFAVSAALCTRARIPRPASSAIIAASEDPFLGAKAITEAGVSTVSMRIPSPSLKPAIKPANASQNVVYTMQDFFWQDVTKSSVGAFQGALWQSGHYLA